MKISCVLELFKSSGEGDTARVISLINEGEVGDINSSNLTGATPLMAAALHGHSETVLALLRNGANVNAVNNLQQSALHYAVAHGCLETIRVLITHGAHVNVESQEGETPLSIAVKMDRADIIDLLEYYHRLRNKLK